MGRKQMLELTQDTRQELAFLAKWLGFPEELAAAYAIRLVSACVREGLLTDAPARAWPQEARALRPGGARAGGKVLAFAHARESAEKAEGK